MWICSSARVLAPFGQLGSPYAVVGVRRRMVLLQKALKDLFWDLEGAGAVRDFTVSLVTGYGPARRD